MPIDLIDDDYIDGIIKGSASSPVNPAKTQGHKLRELIKKLRDQIASLSGEMAAMSFKTINGQSIRGSGDLVFEGGGSSISIKSGTSSKSGDGSLIYSFPHGIAGPVARVLVQASSLDAIGDFYPEQTQTDITLHYSVAPPVGSDNLKWNWVVFSTEVAEPANDVFNTGVFEPGVFE